MLGVATTVTAAVVVLLLLLHEHELQLQFVSRQQLFFRVGDHSAVSWPKTQTDCKSSVIGMQ